MVGITQCNELCSVREIARMNKHGQKFTTLGFPQHYHKFGAIYVVILSNKKKLVIPKLTAMSHVTFAEYRGLS